MASALATLRAKMEALQKKSEESEKKAREEQGLRERVEADLAYANERLEQVEKELNVTKAKLAYAVKMIPEIERRRLEEETF